MGSQAIVTRIALIVMLVAGGAWIAPGTGAGAAPDPDLLGHWAFDEGAGPDAMESSGRGPEGEIHGAEWVKGRFGTALRFGGSGAYVTIPELRGLDGSDEMTLEAWVYWEATGRYPNIVSGGRWNPGGFLLFVSDDHCSFRMGKPGKEPFELGRDWAETGANIGRIVLGRWRHLAATFKRPKLTTYLDGEPVGSATWDYPVGFSGELRIGCWSSPNVCHTGLIDEVKIYRRALTPEEIRASYLKEAPRRQVAEGEAPYERIPVEATRLEPAVTLETRCARLWLDRKARVISLADKAAKSPEGRRVAL
ncbi:MAG TPA: LamG domain-containing protein, partial [Armatimonadota bacterium]|nr:LamG domain-containing protein [Armatimonadota bacterium]